MSSQGRHIIKTARGQATASRPQRHRIRFPSLEQAMEYEDNAVDVRRYPSHVKADEPKPRKRTQPRGVGQQSWKEKD